MIGHIYVRMLFSFYYNKALLSDMSRWIIDPRVAVILKFEAYKFYRLMALHMTLPQPLLPLPGPRSCNVRDIPKPGPQSFYQIDMPLPPLHCRGSCFSICYEYDVMRACWPEDHADRSMQLGMAVARLILWMASLRSNMLQGTESSFFGTNETKAWLPECPCCLRVGVRSGVSPWKHLLSLINIQFSTADSTSTNRPASSGTSRVTSPSSTLRVSLWSLALPMHTYRLNYGACLHVYKLNYGACLHVHLSVKGIRAPDILYYKWNPIT